MRGQVSMAVLVLLPLVAMPVRASNPDDKPVDQDTITALEARISQAQPREQCYLYAQLIHQMTEFSLKLYAAGNFDKADAMLKQIQTLAHKVHMTVNDDNKRLKNAEILLRHTAFRLNEMLHSSNYEDRPLVAQTLAQVNQADNAAMLEVFKK